MTRPSPSKALSGPFERLLAEARAGSGEALGKVFELCQPLLLRLGHHVLRPDLRAKSGADDLVQQTFLEAHRDLWQFRGQTQGAFVAWLRGILLHNFQSLCQHYRGRGKQPAPREVSLDQGSISGPLRDDLAARGRTPSSELRHCEQTQAAEQALRRLPANYHQVLFLRFFEHRSYEEIGRRLGCSAEAARKLHTRALSQVAQQLKALAAKPT
jgi:RNA polymerase sigma-70 factor (ECF subfamily)